MLYYPYNNNVIPYYHLYTIFFALNDNILNDCIVPLTTRANGSDISMMAT